MTKKPTPMARCSRCGQLTNNVTMINQNCTNRKCKGGFQSMLGNDWKDCPKCEATGKIDGHRCEYCEGYGHICIRPKIF